MKIAMSDVASVTRYTRRQSDGATGCVCLKNGTVHRVRNIEPFVEAQARAKPPIDNVFDLFDSMVKRVLG